MISLLLCITLTQNAPPPNPELQAAMQLGAKSAAVQRKLPVVNQVVLVPDEATYLDEIAKWSTENRWPVLFNQEPRASQFIRRFSPERVWVRESVGKMGDVAETMQQTVAHAWDGEESVSDALQNVHLSPLGVVITSPNDHARVGAVALAAGRGQLLLYMKNEWGSPNKIMSESTTASLMQEVEKTLQNTGLSFSGTGDAIDAITVCMKLPARVNLENARENPVAVSDVIGRNANGNRFAWTGWIFGNKSDSAYMAMCSLFLERDNYWFCNTYPNKGAWATYGPGNVPEILSNYGIQSTVVDGSLAELQETDKAGLNTDVVYFTSKGNQDFLDMSDERTAPTWLPIINDPSVLYFLHSWSLKTPSNRSTVGGTWLSRGVYSYIGSSHEPMLHAFVPPVEVLRRTMSLVPFLIAGRRSAGTGMYSEPWRINTIGDPLMLCTQPSAVKRVKKSAKKEPRFQNLASIAQVNMKIATELKSDRLFAEAIQSVVLLGKDTMAISLWGVAGQDGAQGEACAIAVLPALFREGKVDAFLSAFASIESPNSLQQDMLWQLTSSYSSTPLDLLIKNIRGPYHADDVLIIADRIVATRGKAKLLNLINECLSVARGQNKRTLERMRKKYDK